MSIPDDVLEQLRKHRIEQKKHWLAVGAAYQDRDLVVCEIDGTEWNPRSFTPAFTSMAKELGFGHVYFHMLRHTAVATLIAADAHPKVIQGIARHHSAAFTMDRYGHVGDTLQAQALARQAASCSETPLSPTPTRQPDRAAPPSSIQMGLR